jgi:16S rRNA (cytidine1402-2'-O)-methyltransferase
MKPRNPPVGVMDRGSKGSSIDQHGRLLVCATPIGNLQDVTLRVLAALREADVIACEDTRRTRILLDRHGIRAARLVSVHEHNERARTSELAARVRAGETVALLSDAGTPLVSDPGYALVRQCIAEGLAVEVLPGPSAVIAALSASGMAAHRWRFVGFLPRRRGELERLLRGARDTTIAFESPRRLAATLGLLAERDPERMVAVCRELTKLHEEVRRGPVAELARHFAASAPRGEVVVVIAASESDRAGSEERERALGALRELIAAGARPRAAASVVSKLTGLAANELYRELASERAAPRRQ